MDSARWLDDLDSTGHARGLTTMCCSTSGRADNRMAQLARILAITVDLQGFSVSSQSVRVPYTWNARVIAEKKPDHDIASDWQHLRTAKMIDDGTARRRSFSYYQTWPKRSGGEVGDKPIVNTCSSLHTASSSSERPRQYPCRYYLPALRAIARGSGAVFEVGTSRGP